MKPYRDAFLAVDRREEAHAAELEPGDNLGTPPSLFTDSWANPIYPRWFKDAVKIWERHRHIELSGAHQTKSFSESLGGKNSSIDKEQRSQDSEGLQEDENNAMRGQGVDDGTITSTAEETTIPSKNVVNEVYEVITACYDLDQGDAVGASVYDYDWSEEQGEAKASEKRHTQDEEDDTKLLIQSGDQKDEQGKMLEESGSKCIEAQPKFRKPEEKVQESSKESKQPISKKTDEVTKKPGTSTISKNRWRDPLEEQRVAELVREYQQDPNVPEKDKYGQVKWRAIAAMLLERHGYDRTPDSIKCKFARKIRKSANYDERGQKKRNANRMQTSVESPESRKRKRQAQAQASGEPLSIRKRTKARPREGKQAQENNNRVNFDQGLISHNANQGDCNNNAHEEGLNGDGFNEDDETDSRNFERRLPPQFQQFDWSPSKNKGKRKRHEYDGEQASEKHAQMPRSF